jgi:hypothetical protein
MERESVSAQSLVAIIRQTSHMVELDSSVDEGQRGLVCKTLAAVNLRLHFHEVQVNTRIDGVTRERQRAWRSSFQSRNFDTESIRWILTILRSELDRVERYKLYLELGHIYEFRHIHRDAGDLLKLGADLVCNILSRLDEGADRKRLACTSRDLREYEIRSRPRLTLSSTANSEGYWEEAWEEPLQKALLVKALKSTSIIASGCIGRIIQLGGIKLHDFDECTFNVQDWADVRTLMKRATRVSIEVPVECMCPTLIRSGLINGRRLDAFKNVWSLRLQLVHMEWVALGEVFKGFKQLLRFLPNLRALYVTRAEGPSVMETILRSAPRLTTLSIWDSDMASLLNARLPPLGLTSLEYTETRNRMHIMDSNMGLANLIATCKETLTTLRIDHHFGTTMFPGPDTFYKLLPTTNVIETLTVCCWDALVNILNASGRESVRQVQGIHLLETFSATSRVAFPLCNLTNVVIGDEQHPGAWDSVDLGNIAGYLAVHKTAFPNLCHLQLKMPMSMVQPHHLIQACAVLSPTRLEIGS